MPPFRLSPFPLSLLTCLEFCPFQRKLEQNIAFLNDQELGIWG
jgi:hypothetical protein